MQINPKKCVACGNCTYVCPMGAIYIDPVLKRATIDRDECVECYTCFNGLSQEHLNPTIVRTTRKIFQMLRLRFDPEPDVCPTAAFEPDELTWPRVVRRAFSDPRVPHESTGVEGRGTEEVKTNDISGRVKPGEAGFTIEFGRPGVGVWMREIDDKFVRNVGWNAVAFAASVGSRGAASSRSAPAPADPSAPRAIWRAKRSRAMASMPKARMSLRRMS